MNSAEECVNFFLPEFLSAQFLHTYTSCSSHTCTCCHIGIGSSLYQKRNIHGIEAQLSFNPGSSAELAGIQSDRERKRLVPRHSSARVLHKDHQHQKMDQKKFLKEEESSPLNRGPRDQGSVGMIWEPFSIVTWAFFSCKAVNPPRLLPHLQHIVGIQEG